MKKIFLAAAVAVSAVAIAATTSTPVSAIHAEQSYQDTVPGKRDTSTLPKPDTTTPPALMFSK